MQHTQQTHSARPTRQEALCPGGLPVPVACGPLRLESRNPKHVRQVGACSSPKPAGLPRHPVARLAVGSVWQQDLLRAQGSWELPDGFWCCDLGTRQPHGSCCASEPHERSASREAYSGGGRPFGGFLLLPFVLLKARLPTCAC